MITVSSIQKFFKYALSGIIVGGSVRVIHESTKKWLGHSSYREYIPKQQSNFPQNRGARFSNEALTTEKSNGYPQGFYPRE